MKIEQVAHAVFNDRETEKVRSLALAEFLSHGDRTRAIHKLMPVIVAEIKKPVYEGVDFSGDAMTGAAICFALQLSHAVDLLRGEGQC